MFNFKKVASVLTSAVMLSSTIGFAAAASYPSPFVDGGTADGAVVYGANAAISDVTAAINVQQKLGSLVSSAGGGSDAAVVGEAAALFSGGTKLFINDSLNTVKNVLTESALPTVLKDGSFSGNVDASTTQKINIGSNPKVQFKKQPTSSDDPMLALTTSTTQANYIYNSTVTFSKAVNFSHADSEGETLDIFGTTYTIGSATDTDTIVLLRSAERLTLDSDNPSSDVTIDGSVYNIELVSTSDSTSPASATIKITDSSGNSESKKINEAASKKVNGITIAVVTADETNIKLSATVIAGSDKITLEDGSSVTTGEEDDLIDGTLIDFETGNPNNLTRLTMSIYAPEADLDAIKAGDSFVDPVYGSFKVDFSGFNIEAESDSREDIAFNINGDDKIEIAFADHRGNQKTIQWAKNTTSKLELMGDDNDRNITIFEREKFHYQDFVVVGNEDEGHMLQLSAVKNASSGTSSDKVEFKDIFSGDIYKTSWTSDGVGSVDIGGKSFDVTLEGIHTLSSEVFNVSLGHPDSSGTGVAVIYPTIQTEKGAKVAFTEPVTITNMSLWDGTNALTELKFPDGDGYTSVSSIAVSPDIASMWNFTAGGTPFFLNTTETGNSTTVAIGQLTYNFTTTGVKDQIKIFLTTVANTGNIISPAIVIFEEKDDNSNYEALIVELEPGATSDDGLGIDTIEDTWSAAASGWSTTRYSDSKKTDRSDLWGSLITLDSADSDQKSAVISYPDEQVYAQIYIAEESAAITPGTSSSGSGGQVMIVKDSEVSSVAGSNLFVVGGSCINTAAAKILGSDSPLCESDFTDATGAGPGQYIIKSVVSPYSDSKTALLVAGYAARDTENAVDKVLEGVDTTTGSEQVYPVTSA